MPRASKKDRDAYKTEVAHAAALHTSPGSYWINPMPLPLASAGPLSGDQFAGVSGGVTAVGSDASTGSN